MFFETEPRETLRFEGNKINCFPRDQSLSDLLYSWKFIKPRCNGGRRSTFTGNSTLLPSDVIDFAMLPAQRFWRETVSLLDVMWPRSNQWDLALLGKNFQFCYTTELRETPLSILMTCHYEDLSCTFDWLKQICNQLNFCARSSDFIWRENQ